MKIVHLISSGGFYGAENMLINLLEGLRDLKVEVSLCIFESEPDTGIELALRAAELGISVIKIPCKGRFDIAAVKQIRSYLDSCSASILHTHGYKADLYGYVVTRRLSCTLVSTCHNWTKASRALRLYSVLDKLVLRTFSRVVSVSPQVAEELRRDGVSDDRLRLIANGVRVPKQPAPTARSETAILTVGMATRLVEEKGIGELFRAVAKLLSHDRHLRVVIAGDGALRQAFEQQASTLDISASVTFLGFVADMQSFYASLDIFVLPSLREGLPMSVLEAMAIGKPVIASRVGAIPTVIVHNQSGLLIPPADAAALEAALSRLIDDAGLRVRLGINARAVIETSYSAAVMTRHYLDMYRSTPPRSVNQALVRTTPPVVEQS